MVILYLQLETSSAFFPLANYNRGSSRWLSQNARDLLQEVWDRPTSLQGFGRACPAGVSREDLRFLSPLSARSKSSWAWKINEDTNRFPSRILEACCLSNHSCGNCTARLPHEPARSEPITVSMIVAVRENASSTTSRYERQDFVVGCTCTCL